MFVSIEWNWNYYSDSEFYYEWESCSEEINKSCEILIEQKIEQFRMFQPVVRWLIIIASMQGN